MRKSLFLSSRPKAERLYRLCDLADCERERPLSHRDVVPVRRVVAGVERARHHLLEFSVYLGLAPVDPVEVLNPFKITHANPARVRENVWHDEDVVLSENFVRVGSGRTIGGLADDPRLHAGRVQACNRILKGCGNQNVDVEREELAVCDLARPRHPRDRPGLLLVLQDLLRVKSGARFDSTARVSDGNDLSAELVEKESAPRPGVAVSLDSGGRALEGDVPDSRGLPRADDAASRRRVVSPLGTAEKNGLSRHTFRYLVPLDLGVGVENPSHGLRIGVDVRCGDVPVWSDEIRNHRSVSSSQLLLLSERHRFGVAYHATLSASVRNVDDRALPSHPGCERLDLVKGDVGVIPDPAFARAPCVAVLHPVALKVLQPPVVHLDWNGDGEDPLWFAKHLEDVGVEFYERCSTLELPHGVLVCIQLRIARARFFHPYHFFLQCQVLLIRSLLCRVLPLLTLLSVQNYLATQKESHVTDAYLPSYSKQCERIRKDSSAGKVLRHVI